jgi:uracil permease
MALLQTIPSCVMGGVCLTLYGFIAVSGLKMFKELDLADNKNLFVVSAILIAGIGGLTLQIPYSIADNGAVAKTIQVTSIATALILGIVTNFVLGKIEKSKLGVDSEETEENGSEE